MDGARGSGGVPLTVDLPALRTVAGRLADEAYPLGHGLAGVPGLALTEPRWHNARALSELESAVHTWFGALGGRLADTATAVRTAADRYAATDERAGRRLPTPAR
ncbi:hypothetical protein [Micromonospora sagamiensis]|uniref:Excreted virulence factor EspC (Type VII ESX diderm) n=1 Tax=Micromonospora sagamiensis TaxID=47875 RepID=A0A562WAJ6_9ACTN|nr:hypothetical protein [Micromonospora sagamiensis]TWJ27138.1 excreted virulence factor EspC (type VII ESX diderm) [Micromonospora sagamiensis]